MRSVLRNIGVVNLLNFIPRKMAALAFIAVSVFSLTACGDKAPDKVMMNARTVGALGLFDATQWFHSGMYEQMEVQGEISQVMMKRKEPFVFKAKDNVYLVQAAIEAIDEMRPEVSSQPLWDQWPVLTRRTRYVYSEFETENQPVDVYEIYLQMSYKRYLVRFGVDVKTDAILPMGEAEEMRGGNDYEDPYLKIFDELDDAGTR